jgi:hypothetical protein
VHANAQVLYPISDPVEAAPFQPRPRPRVVYLGGLTRGYGRMISALSRAYTVRPDAHPWELAIFGEVGDWPAADVAHATTAGTYRGPRSGAAARRELTEADVFLAVMDFETATRRRVRTSFPSKLLDYCARSKPVVAWAPEYSSLARFAQRMESPPLEASPDPAALIARLDESLRDPAWMTRQAAAAGRLGATIFSPDAIHARLVELVEQLLHRRARPAATAS